MTNTCWLDVVGADGTVVHTTAHGCNGAEGEWVIEVNADPWVRLTQEQLFEHVARVVRDNTGCHVEGVLAQEFETWCTTPYE